MNDATSIPGSNLRLVPRHHAWAVVIVATLTMTISYVDRQTLSVLAPTVCDLLKIDDAAYGWLASAFSFAYLVGAPIAGRWVDRAGARRALPTAVVVWSIVAASHALAFTFASLFLMRVMLGLAEAPSFPGAAQSVDRILPPADRARGVGLLFTGSSIGALIAPSIATKIAGRWDFRAAFIGTAILGLCWLPLWLVVTRDPRVRAALEPDPHARNSTMEPGAPARVDARAIVTSTAVIRGSFAVFASAPTVAFMLLWGAKFLSGAYHVPQSEIARYAWLPPLCFDIGAIFFGDLAARTTRRDPSGTPHRRLFIVATLLTTVLALVPFAHDAWTATFGIAVAVTGGGAVFSLLMSDMLARVPTHAVSFAAGTTAAAQSLAYVVASPLIGRSVRATHSYDHALIVLGLWAIPGAIVWLCVAPGARRVG